MNERPFKPGFRFSRLDAIVLAAGAIGAVGVSMLALWIGVAIAFVVAHFFLFCNVLRMSRALELLWAGLFAALATSASIVGRPDWPWVFLIAMVATVVVAAVESRKVSYHGIGWRRLNPRLPEWWREKMMPHVDEMENKKSADGSAGGDRG